MATSQGLTYTDNNPVFIALLAIKINRTDTELIG